jgi:hypothetical protein
MPLAAFRGTTRPVIIAGSRGKLSQALAGAEPFQEALRERGVSVVPLQMSEDDAAEKLRALKAEFGGGAASGGSKGFGSGGGSGGRGGGGEAAVVEAKATAAAGLTSKASCGCCWRQRAA